MIVLAIAAMIFRTGDTMLDVDTWAKPDLTISEKVFVADSRKAIAEQCPSAEVCRINLETLLMEAVNGRRINARVMRYSRTADTLSYTCNSNIIAEKLQCYSDLRNLSYGMAMQRAGYRHVGVSREAYRRISIGMDMRDVEYIMGVGEEQAYSGGYGHSASIYRWKRGNAAIILTFTDSAVSAKGQFGL